jgi:luciferase family oxidoreductase group 1
LVLDVIKYRLPLSVLDVAPVASGSSPGDALRNSLELVQLTERLGYHRYWVAEHHNMPGIASSAPAVLIAHLASVTSTIRVGSGGVMLPNHAPLVVAEQFGMLEALHPGRIDLGIGRAPGTDPATARALRGDARSLGGDEFPSEFGNLLGFFHGSFPAGHPYRHVRAVPGEGNQPAIWLLGSSDYSAEVAGLLGLPFSFAHHFSPANTLPALARYRASFRPSSVLAEPYSMVAVNVVCSDTDEEAARQAAPLGLAFVRLYHGRPAPFPSPEESERHNYTDAERAMVQSRLASQVVGSPSTVRAGLEELAAETDADELMISTMIHGHADRLRSYELVAEAMSAAIVEC